MRALFAILAALFLGCGTAQLAERPEALVDGTFPPPLPRQQRPGKDGKCRPPPWGGAVIAKNGACWTELDATEAQCKEAARENPYHVWHEGKCWYFLPGDNRKPEPTSSVQGFPPEDL